MFVNIHDDAFEIFDCVCIYCHEIINIQQRLNLENIIVFKPRTHNRNS